MPRNDEIDCSTLGVSLKYHRYYASCWRCNRNSVLVDLTHLPPETNVLRLKPKCRQCGKRGQWTVIPIVTESMRPR